MLNLHNNKNSSSLSGPLYPFLSFSCSCAYTGWQLSIIIYAVCLCMRYFSIAFQRQYTHTITNLPCFCALSLSLSLFPCHFLCASLQVGKQSRSEPQTGRTKQMQHGGGGRGSVSAWRYGSRDIPSYHAFIIRNRTSTGGGKVGSGKPGVIKYSTRFNHPNSSPNPPSKHNWDCTK